LDAERELPSVVMKKKKSAQLYLKKIWFSARGNFSLVLKNVGGLLLFLHNPTGNEQFIR